MRALIHLIYDEKGATVIEYGLIAALISIVAIAAMGLVGGSLSNVFSTIAANLSASAR